MLISPTKQKTLLTKLGQTVKQRRVALTWSQETLAEKCELTRNFISLIECGDANPSLINLINLATALDITLPELLDDLT